MKARKLSPKPHLLTVTYPSGTVKTLHSPTERVARERILYILHDNLRMSMTESNRHANAVEISKTYETDGFQLILERINP